MAGRVEVELHGEPARGESQWPAVGLKHFRVHDPRCTGFHQGTRAQVRTKSRCCAHKPEIPNQFSQTRHVGPTVDSRFLGASCRSDVEVVGLVGSGYKEMNPEVKDLVLRVHTRIDDANSFQPRGQKQSGLRSPKWSTHALLIDCETTTEELGQKLNFGFYRKCKLIHKEYKTIEEGIIIADDLEKRLGQKAVVLLNSFDKHRADTVCGRFATIRVYTRSEFVTKCFSRGLCSRMRWLSEQISHLI